MEVIILASNKFHFIRFHENLVLDPSNNKFIHLIETEKKYGQSKLAAHTVLQMITNKKVGNGNGKIKDIPTLYIHMRCP